MPTHTLTPQHDPHMPPDSKHDLAVQAAQAAPSVAAIIATKVLNLDVQSWLGLFGIGFIALQAAYLVWKWRRDVKREREREAAGTPPPLDSDRAPL